MRKYTCAPCNEVVSSNCVIYSGPAIPALGIECEEPLNAVIAAIVAEIVETTPQSIDLSSVDLKCLASSVNNSDIKNILEVVLTSHCSLKQMVEDINANTNASDLLITWGCMDTSGNNPTPVSTTTAINRVVSYVCNLKTSLETSIQTLNTRMSQVETTVNDITVPTLPIFNTTSLGGTSTSPLETTVNLLISRLVSARADIGSIGNIYPNNLVTSFGGQTPFNNMVTSGVPGGIPTGWANLGASITTLAQTIANLNNRIKSIEERLSLGNSQGLSCGLVFNLFGNFLSSEGVECSDITMDCANAGTTRLDFYVSGITNATDLGCSVNSVARTAVAGTNDTDPLTALSSSNFWRIQVSPNRFRVVVQLTRPVSGNTVVRISNTPTCYYEFIVTYVTTGTTTKTTAVTLTQTFPALNGESSKTWTQSISCP